MRSDDQIVELGARALTCDEAYQDWALATIRRVLGVYAAAGLVLEQGWRFDMENAPRDGTWVLLFLPASGGDPETIVQAQWSDTLQGHWAEAFSDAWIYAGAPTAFRPLPTPPATGGEDG